MKIYHVFQTFLNVKPKGKTLGLSNTSGGDCGFGLIWKWILPPTLKPRSYYILNGHFRSYK